MLHVTLPYHIALIHDIQYHFMAATSTCTIILSMISLPVKQTGQHNKSLIFFTIRCSDIQFGLEDIATYVHLLNVALNTKLCLGKINDALELGTYITQLQNNAMHCLPL